MARGFSGKPKRKAPVRARLLVRGILLDSRQRIGLPVTKPISRPGAFESIESTFTRPPLRGKPNSPTKSAPDPMVIHVPKETRRVDHPKGPPFNSPYGRSAGSARGNQRGRRGWKKK